ncbi:DegT/DnrJ/EryC1/StrS family aminotransferase [candidate division TA06 bacterium]|uniref:DegT/DnrJ/EryC1/StrS family aminotransferase n=1 Tax=candidate division TA06 bacterium TaxID=2250710 RepID=A0A933I9V7_UNCT6|nr:DegT/DnrJ/EryC1/StrS family aminotransferase [candidate division TA06 bacterium]
MKVAFADIKSTYTRLKPELDVAYARVMDSGRYILGEEVGAFEKEFASFCGAGHCVAVANGLEALELILKGYGLGQGHEVIVPANTCIATWLAVTNVGARPVPVEPDLKTFNIDPGRVEKATTSKTRAIMAVHLYGLPAEMDKLGEIAARRRILLIEDAAQAHGAGYRGRTAGNLGQAAAFSFYPTKNLGAFGDAGAVVTSDGQLAEKVRLLRNYGSPTKYQHLIPGGNSRMDPLQAAFLRVKLKHLEQWNRERRMAAASYQERLGGLKDLVLPQAPKDCEPCWHQYVVRTKHREKLKLSLEQAGIETMVHYPIPPHLSPAYSSLKYKTGDFPLTEEIADTALSLPMGLQLSSDAQDYVINEIIKALK